MPAYLTERRLSLGAIAIAAIAGASIPIASGGMSPYVVLESAMVILSLVPGAAAIHLGRLNVTRHLPFWILYAEVVVYLYLAPAAYVARGMPDRNSFAPIYLGLQLAILAFFLVPLIVLYGQWTARDGAFEPVRWRLSRIPLAAFIAVCLVLPVSYLALLARHGLLYRRLGWDSLAQSLVALPRLDFLVIRSFEALAVPLLCLLLLAVRDARGGARIWLWLCLISVGSVTLFDAALNSRLQWILALVLPLVVIINARPPSSHAWRYWLALGFVILSALYGVRVVENMRFYAMSVTQQSTRQSNPSSLPGTAVNPSSTPGPALNPGSVAGAALNPISAPSAADTPLAFRLNGLDLMARMTPVALKQGFSWGRSWWPSVVVEIGQVVAPRIANRYKLALATEPKWYLMRDYKVANLADYPSSALTDAYGNLGPLGLPLGAVIYALLLAGLTRWMRRGSPVHLVIALFLLADVAYFEASFIGIALRWVHYAPAALLLVALNPLRRESTGTTNLPHPMKRTELREAPTLSA